MIWLTWRQHRRQALAAVLGLAVLAAVMVPTGLAMRETFTRLGLPECLQSLAASGPASTAGCGGAISQFNNQYRTLSAVSVLLVFLPLLVGLFWGAPLVAREVEHGTHRLVWTQSISRRHWAYAKCGLVGGAAVVAAAVYGLGMSWWFEPLSQVGSSRLSYLAFDVQGLAPLGYTLFALALGIFAGTVWRRMIPAMAVALAGFLALRVALTVLVRPRYLAARTSTFPVDGIAGSADVGPGDWILSMGVRDAAGVMVANNTEFTCGGGGGDLGAGAGCVAQYGAGAYNWQLYQPASRFWLFQSIETSIFVALGAALIFFAIRNIRRLS